MWNDRSLTDLFAVQDEITLSIVATVAPEVEEAEMQRVRRERPETLGAWECAMRAQWHLARMTREDIDEALRLATQATALDPGTTRGLNIAAIAHLYAIAEGWAPSLPQSIMAAYQLASKAVAVDPRDAASHAALAACEGGASLELLPMVTTGFLRLVTNRKGFASPTPMEAALKFVDSLLAIPGVEMPEVGREKEGS